MTGIVSAQLRGLAGTLAGLKERVRAAVAGELGRAVGEAVRQVVQAVAADRLEPPAPPRPSRWDDDRDDTDGWDRPGDPWRRDDGHGDEDDGFRAPARPRAPGAAPPAGATVPAVAGALVARWWVSRRGTPLSAAGLGLGVTLLGALGGPLARAAVAVLAAAAEVLTAADALGAAGARLARV